MSSKSSESGTLQSTAEEAFRTSLMNARTDSASAISSHCSLAEMCISNIVISCQIYLHFHLIGERRFSLHDARRRRWLHSLLRDLGCSLQTYQVAVPTNGSLPFLTLNANPQTPALHLVCFLFHQCQQHSCIFGQL